MERVEAAYQLGVAEAQRDIAAGQPRLRLGARSAWGKDLAQTLQARFGVELMVLSCFRTDESSSFDEGYNCSVRARIDGIHGVGAVAGAWQEVQRRRNDSYKSWCKLEGLSDPGDETEGETPFVSGTPRSLMPHFS